MKVSIPESIQDITLEQFQTLVALDDDINERDLDIEKVKIFIGLTDEQIDSISESDFKDLVLAIDEALNKPSEFQQRFKMNGVEFGFHPNLDKMLTGEYVDLMNYNSEPETLHKLMAILFRPITTKDLSGNYKIAKYEGSETWCEIMKQTPLHIVNGALIFFLNLSKELRTSIQKYSTAQELAKGSKHQIFGLNGDGMQPS